MKSDTSSAEFTGDQILNELYINPYLHEVEQFLRAEETSPVRISFIGFTPTLCKRPQKLLFKSFRRAEVTPAMACTNYSFREAQDIYPHLVQFL